ncbi:secretin N-terminal domain-containing protein [Aeromonas jandaei]|uniref:secretin N-terminal domain-containing protein n=1 Tax=Aeromonas jandaei TaxID=650 RepID=UPI003BA1E05C
MNKNILSAFILCTTGIIFGCGTPQTSLDNPNNDTPFSGVSKDVESRTKIANAETNMQQLSLEKIRTNMARGDNDITSLDAINRLLDTHPNNLRALQLKRHLEQRITFSNELVVAKTMWPHKPQEALMRVNRVLLEQPDYSPALELRERWMRESDHQTLQPALTEALNKPVTLNFRSQPIGDIFNIISQVTGLDFIFDQGINATQQASIIVKHTTVADALNLLLRTNQLDKKVLSSNTLLIYPSSKTREYQELQVRIFYLIQANANVVQNVIRQTTAAKNIQIDERANALIIRDTPEMIAVVERLVSALDVAQSEVTLDVQILEVNTDEALEVGVDYPKEIVLSTTDKVTIGDLLNMNKNNINVSQISTTINMLHQNGKTKVLANPKIRVRNLETAEIKIGEQIPLVTTTVSNGVTSESVNYQDVGLTLNVEPRISLNNEVGIKVKLVSSSVLNKKPTAQGSDVYSLANRSAETVLTARDGDTQVLAGLINQEQKYTRTGLPYTNSIGWLDDLLDVKSKEDKSTELILLITPHIERTLELPPAYNSHFVSGSEEQVSTTPLAPRQLSSSQVTDL